MQCWGRGILATKKNSTIMTMRSSLDVFGGMCQHTHQPLLASVPLFRLNAYSFFVFAEHLKRDDTV